MNLIEGVDVSHWQKRINWQKLKAEGHEFAFVKATEGSDYVDPMFKAHVQGAQEAGILVGAYHYFKPRLLPDDQVEHFMNVVSSVKLDLPPALDLETMDGLTAPVVKTSTLRWLIRVELGVSRRPIIYSGLYFINGLNNPHEYAKYPLWLAQYRNRMPTIPHPFEKWTFWQNSGTNLDHDYFNGTMEELKAL